MTYRMLTTFIGTEDGGAAFDWKVLTGLAVGLGIAVGTFTYDGSKGAVVNVESTLEDESLPDRIFPGRTTN
ncbi:hypothetical protein ILP92_00610 [Maribius pontilimi]|uniref:Flp pilus assembly protein, pilin Flp n=1 Tax=Palleronia pontilimi TaxID=1964209 RepID=A0A934M8C7_9RHOB|nr:hypothetical protein [Palleronia pontilimi]MBJ3761252.1 hypothetical protein [Palleronia pontilimi]